MNKIKLYEIKEIYPGHYFMMLDMLDISDVLKIISNEYKYIWLYEMKACSAIWNKVNVDICTHPLKDTWIRNVNFECLVETTHIKDMINNLDYGISLIQLNELPPPYLRMDKTTMSEKTKYDQLTKLGYLFNLHIPHPSDYGWIICSDFEYMREIVEMLTD